MKSINGRRVHNNNVLESGCRKIILRTLSSSQEHRKLTNFGGSPHPTLTPKRPPLRLSCESYETSKKKKKNLLQRRKKEESLPLPPSPYRSVLLSVTLNRIEFMFISAYACTCVSKPR